MVQRVDATLRPLLAAAKQVATGPGPALVRQWIGREYKEAWNGVGGRALTDAPEFFRRDPDVVLAAVRKDPAALRHASLELLADRGFLLCALEANERDPSGEEYHRNHGRSFSVFPLELLPTEITKIVGHDRDLARAAVANGWMRFSHVAEEFKHNKDFVRSAIWETRDYCGYRMSARVGVEQAHRSLSTDRELILFSAGLDRNAPVLTLNFASPDLRADEGVVLTAVAQDCRAFQWANARLRNNKKFVERAMAAYVGGPNFKRGRRRLAHG